jgi:sulfoxide reductase heme-binding subunit YedZ
MSSPKPSDSAIGAPRVGLQVQGKRVVYLALLIFGLMCGVSLLADGFGEEGFRLAIRSTARTTALVFAFVFCTSALRRRWPGPGTNWLMRNRRYLGLAAAVSHGYHLIFILALYSIGEGGDTPIATVAGGSFGFVMLAALVATSNDASQRRLRKNWRRLHLFGIWTIWIIFAVSYLPAAGATPIAVSMSAVLVVALALRVWPRPRKAHVPN